MTVKYFRPQFKATAEEVTAGLDLTGKVAIVTGGTSGIGQETVRVLLLRGAYVIDATRSVAHGEDIKAELLKKIPTGKMEVMRLDLEDLSSVRAFAAQFLAKNLPLHYLINNAGIMATPFTLTKDGIEVQFETNYLGHFLLTNLLLGALKATAAKQKCQTTIVNVSSDGHSLSYDDGIRLHRINDPDGYEPLQAYAQSKLAQILHVRELSRRFEAEGVKVTANAVHPGIVKTNISRFYTNKYLVSLYFWAMSMANKLKTLQQGAATTLFVAVNPETEGISGQYFADCSIDLGSSLSRQADLAEMLWALSEQMCGTES